MNRPGGDDDATGERRRDEHEDREHFHERNSLARRWSVPACLGRRVAALRTARDGTADEAGMADATGGDGA